MLVVLLGLRLGRALLTRRFAGDLASKLIDPLTQLADRFPRVPLFTPALVAVVAAIATFGAALLAPGAGVVSEAVIFLTGLAGLIGIVVRGRAIAARQAGVKLAQRG